MSQTAPPSTLSLVRQLWQQTWPMALGVMSLLGFYLVDSIFVARLGTAPLAAQSFTFPLAFLVIGVQVGIGIAIAALISRAIGAGQQDQANRLGALVLTGGGLMLGALVLFLWLIQTPAFTLIGASEAIRELIRPYWAIQVLAMWVGGVLYFGYSLFRAHGNTRFPGLMMVLTSLLNLILDPLLIFGVGDWDGFGLPGAALASLLAFAIGLGILVLALRGKGWVQRHGMLLQMRVSAWPFAQIAGPAMISQLMPPLAAMLATALVARAGAGHDHGPAALAGPLLRRQRLGDSAPPDARGGGHGDWLAGIVGTGDGLAGGVAGQPAGGDGAGAGLPGSTDPLAATELWPARHLHAGGLRQ